jgi:hypothetical protein
MEASATALQVGPIGLPASLFWDCNLGTLDATKHAAQVIERVLEYGGLEEWRMMRRHYGDERMKQVVTQLRCLSPQSVRLCCIAFDLQPEDFRCCTARPFPPAPWSY